LGGFIYFQPFRFGNAGHQVTVELIERKEFRGTREPFAADNAATSVLLGFLMLRMSVAEFAILLESQLLGRGPFILG
jgi:hypothetical protein